MAVGLAERDGALAMIRTLLDRAVTGHGGAVFVLGEAGLGKTALLDQAVELAAGRMAIGIGRADVAEAALPFGLLGQALRPLIGSQVLDVADGTDRADERAANHLSAILGRLRQAAVRPLLIAVDDTHWSDPDSLTLLRLICRRLPDLPVAVVATARPWPPQAARAATELAAEDLAELERLVPLTDAAATALVTGQLGELTGQVDVDSAVAACAGNPLLLSFVVAQLLSGQALPDHAGGPGGSWAARLLLSRFTGVGAAAESYLQAASVLGRRFRPEVAAEMAGLGPAQAAHTRQTLAAAGLVADDGEGWATFSHHLVRLAVYDQAAPARTHLHELAFRVLLARKAPAAETAEHAAAARLADPVALEVIIRAGRQALQHGAPGTACHHLAAAVRLAGDEAPPDVLLDLAEALRVTGDNEGAAEACQQLLDRAELPRPVFLAALSVLAQAEFRAGRIEEASARIDRAAHLVEAEPSELAAVALVDQAHLSVLRLGPRAALPLAARARSVAAGVGGQIQAVADAVWAQCAYLSGDPTGLAVAKIAADDAPGRIPEVTQWSDPRVLYAELAAWSENFDQAESLLVDVLAGAAQRRYPMNLFEGRSLLAAVQRRTGRLNEALEVCEQLLGTAELMPFALPLALAEQALALLDLGQLDRASHCCQRVSALTAGSGGLGRVWTTAHLARAVLAFRRGQMPEASRIFAQLERSARRVDLNEPCIYPWAHAAIAAHLACDRPDAAAGVVEWLRPRAAALPSRWPRAVLAAGQAALAERAGDLRQAEEGFARAVDLHHPAMVLARAEALTDQGRFLLRHGQPARARPLLAQALHLTEECGATWHAEQARVGWRRAGGRTRATPAGALTPQERAVADLARAGSTNKEIAAQLYLSVNTVETHLLHVYRKLGITRRWELIASQRPARDG